MMPMTMIETRKLRHKTEYDDDGDLEVLSIVRPWLSADEIGDPNRAVEPRCNHRNQDKRELTGHTELV